MPKQAALECDLSSIRYPLHANFDGSYIQYNCSTVLVYYEAAGNNKITELGKQARQGQLYVLRMYNTTVLGYQLRLSTRRTICVVHYL